MFIAILSEAHSSVVQRAEAEPDPFITQMREGWRRRIRALRKRKYQGTDTVEELAKSLKEAQDAPPGMVHEGSEDDGSRGASAPGTPKGPSKEEVYEKKIKEASSTTLLQALEYGREDEESTVAAQQARADAHRMGPVVGIPTSLVDQLTLRVEQVEKEQQQTADWLAQNHQVPSPPSPPSSYTHRTHRTHTSSAPDPHSL